MEMPPKMLEVEALRSRFLNLEFDRRGFVISPEQTLAVAKSYGETRPELLDPGHADFQVCLPLLASLASGRRLPIDFPRTGGISMDGGKALEIFQPVRPGSSLTGRTHLHDIYAKSGRSGRMIFLVSRMQLYSQAGEHLVNIDARQVIREKEAAKGEGT